MHLHESIVNTVVPKSHRNGFRHLFLLPIPSPTKTWYIHSCKQLHSPALSGILLSANLGSFSCWQTCRHKSASWMHPSHTFFWHIPKSNLNKTQTYYKPNSAAKLPKDVWHQSFIHFLDDFEPGIGASCWRWKDKKADSDPVELNLLGRSNLQNNMAGTLIKKCTSGAMGTKKTLLCRVRACV